MASPLGAQAALSKTVLLEAGGGEGSPAMAAEALWAGGICDGVEEAETLLGEGISASQALQETSRKARAQSRKRFFGAESSMTGRACPRWEGKSS